MRLTLLTLLLELVRSDEIDNGVVGTPKIDCQEGHVDFSVTTQKPFVGRIYTEGFENAEGCGVEAFSPMGTEVSLRIKTSDCGMQMQRMTEPIQGMAFTVSLIVSFHGVFITKVDRAYAIQCYFEQDKALVTNDFEVSPIPETEITGVDRQKRCSYTIHSETKGILVHSCKGTDGRGHEFIFYDDRGCSVDPIIMPQIEYGEGSRNASVESHAFKFSDRETLHLECLISTCDDCAGVSPPVCGRGKRSTREAEAASLKSLPRGTFETIAKIRMFDLYDEGGHIQPRPLGWAFHGTAMRKTGDDEVSGGSERRCLGVAEVALLATLGALFCLIIILSSSILVFRRHNS